MNSRPLPYQGSALPLSYASNCYYKTFKTNLRNSSTLQSYRERSLPSTTRKAKKPSRTQVRERYLPGSIVCHAATATTPMTASAIIMRPLPAGLRSTLSPVTKPSQLQNGAQGRIRTSVRHRRADLQSAAINRSATCAHLYCPTLRHTNTCTDRSILQNL